MNRILPLFVDGNSKHPHYKILGIERDDNRYGFLTCGSFKPVHSAVRDLVTESLGHQQVEVTKMYLDPNCVMVPKYPDDPPIEDTQSFPEHEYNVYVPVVKLWQICELRLPENIISYYWLNRQQILFGSQCSRVLVAAATVFYRLIDAHQMNNKQLK